jgi:hypothetical protein
VLAQDLGAAVALQALGSSVPAEHVPLGIDHVDGVVDHRVDQQIELDFELSAFRGHSVFPLVCSTNALPDGVVPGGSRAILCRP